MDLLGQVVHLLGQGVDLLGKIGVLLQQIGLILGEFLAVRRRCGLAAEPVSRLLGTGWSFARSLNSCSASGRFHSTTEPTLVSSKPPNGTVVVSGFRSANATWISW